MTKACPCCSSLQVQVCEDANNPIKSFARCRECKTQAPLHVWEGRHYFVREAALIVAFWQFVEAGRKLDGDEPFKDDAIVLNYQAHGATCFITAGNFRAFCDVMQIPDQYQD